VIRLLLVEDDAAQVELTRESMRHFKLLNQLEVASSGEAALARLLDGGVRPYPDLVLLDLNLPGMTGLELLEQMQQHPHTRTIPVVVMSAIALDDATRQALQERGTPWVLKPLASAKDYFAIAQAVDRLGFALVLREDT